MKYDGCCLSHVKHICHLVNIINVLSLGEGHSTWSQPDTKVQKFIKFKVEHWKQSMNNTWNLNKMYNKMLDIGKKHDKHLWLEQKVQQIGRHKKKSMMNTWYLRRMYHKKLDIGNKACQTLELKQKWQTLGTW